MSVITDGGLSDLSFIVRQATIDPPSMATTVDGVVAGVAVEGVAVGDAVLAIPPYDMANVMYQATPVSNGVLDVNFYNAGTGTTDLASATWTFLIFKTAAR